MAAAKLVYPDQSRLIAAQWHHLFCFFLRALLAFCFRSRLVYIVDGGFQNEN